MNNEKNTSKKSGGIKSFLKSRKARMGAGAVIVTVLVIVAVILLNLVLAAITNNHPLYLDVTENSAFRLQPETEEFTATVDKPVTIYVLQPESSFESADSANYKYFIQANKLIHAIDDSSDNIDLHYVDLTADPTFTKDYPDIDWTQSHVALVVCGDLYRVVDLTDMFSYDEEQYQYYGTYVINGQYVEQALLTAIMNVCTEDKIKVTVLTGQGEQDMSVFTTLLENNAYEVETVSLLNGSIAEDSEFLIIYDPDVDIDGDIYTTISEWLDNDGKYGHNLVYFPNDQKDVSEFPNLNTLLSDYGMKVRSGYVFENSSDHLLPGYNHYYSIFDYPQDDDTFTKGLRSTEIPVVMSLTMPIDITDETMAKTLLTSTDQAYFIPIDISDEYKESFEPAAELLNGAAIGQRNDGTDDSKSSSVVVIGSYDAVTRSYLGSSSYNNAAYFINIFNTLSEKADVSVVIEGKNPSANELGLTSMESILFPSILVRFVIPIGVLLAGIIIWIRRRYR